LGNPQNKNYALRNYCAVFDCGCLDQLCVCKVAGNLFCNAVVCTVGMANDSACAGGYQKGFWLAEQLLQGDYAAWNFKHDADSLNNVFFAA